MTRVAYLDCLGGISGDMTLGALVDAGVPLGALNEAVASLGLPGCRLTAEQVRKQGFRATQVRVEYEPEHVHRHLGDILRMIDGGRLSPRQRETARRIFTHLAEAEARVHGTSLQKVHFHEVGAADSIADVVGAAVGFDLLGVELVAASPVPTGSGTVRIAHGEVSIPAPATAELLRGVPLAACDVQGEMTTPTGAAILTTLAEGFGPLPAMAVEQIGWGAGQRDWTGRPNLLRLFVGTAAEGAEGPEVCVLETNLDDTSGEMIGYCTSRLWEAGALDVYTTPIGMKKNRPGVKLSVICHRADVAAIEAILFRETTTLGVRRWMVARRVLKREPCTVETPFGPVEGKVGYLDGGGARFAPEFESCRRAAAEQNVPLRDVYEAAQRAFESVQKPLGGFASHE